MKHGKGSKKTSTAKKSPRKGGSKALKQAKPAKAVGGAKRGATRRAAPALRPTDGRGSRSANVTFSNPAVGSAFRRAVKKYSTALKRLTD